MIKIVPKSSLKLMCFLLILALASTTTSTMMIDPTTDQVTTTLEDYLEISKYYSKIYFFQLCLVLTSRMSRYELFVKLRT